MAGPLTGIRIIEFAGIGPGPFCGMMLADHGAEVIRIDRIGAADFRVDALGRSRRSIALNMKSAEGVAVARDLCRGADGIIEGFRPGVMERLGLGPDVLLSDNPALVYGRMTGWGQTGPWAHAAGHDINYIALSGVLHTVGVAGEKPVPPVNYVGDFGGGGMMLAFGMVAALLAVKNGAQGQVIDAAMTDGSALLAAMTWSFYNAGIWTDQPGTNRIDGGAHYYDSYVCADGRFLSIGAIEPQFYALLREKAGLDDAALDAQHDQAQWPALKARLAAVIATKTRDEWAAIFDASDACVAPILSLREAPQHPHNVARDTFVEVGGHIQPAPAPRYSVSRTDPPRPAPKTGTDGEALLAELGYDAGRVGELKAAGVLG